jgi:hypothetical protein
MSSLKSLHIEADDRVDYGSLIKVLGDYLTSVEYLYFNFISKNLSSFKYFTNNCEANLKKWAINFPQELGKDHLFYVNNYQKVHNSLKVLGIENLAAFGRTDEGSEIIALLKDQGVDVVPNHKLVDLFNF